MLSLKFSWTLTSPSLIWPDNYGVLETRMWTRKEAVNVQLNLWGNLKRYELHFVESRNQHFVEYSEYILRLKTASFIHHFLSLAHCALFPKSLHLKFASIPINPERSKTLILRIATASGKTKSNSALSKKFNSALSQMFIVAIIMTECLQTRLIPICEMILENFEVRTSGRQTPIDSIAINEHTYFSYKVIIIHKRHECQKDDISKNENSFMYRLGRSAKHSGQGAQLYISHQRSCVVQKPPQLIIQANRY